MMRLFFILLILISAVVLLSHASLNTNESEIPVFLSQDQIAEDHQTKILIYTHSLYQPDSLQQDILKKDYSNIWAHLNHLYATDDVKKGKDYYTEDWFKKITKHDQGIIPPAFSRTDQQHELHIENWAWDGLACTAIDSNLVLKYYHQNHLFKTTKAHIAVVLLYQGDHWRLDALRVINETNLNR
jgi:hypothetical protein